MLTTTEGQPRWVWFCRDRPVVRRRDAVAGDAESTVRGSGNIGGRGYIPLNHTNARGRIECGDCKKDYENY